MADVKDPYEATLRAADMCTATFSLLPTQNYSGNFTKVTQLVPVKIELERPDPRLMVGTSVEVKIRVQE